MTDLARLTEDLNRLAWQASLLRSQAEADMRRAKFRFVRTMRDAYAKHPPIARLAWWYWRRWLGRGWDGRKIGEQ